MKKISNLLMLTVVAVGFSQEEAQESQELVSAVTKKHELKVGAIKMIAGTIFEGTYEYVHSKDFSYGSSILVNLDKGSSYGEHFSITPFGRFYFQESKEYGANGFFVEGFGKYVSGKVYVNTTSYDSFGYYVYNEEIKNFSAGALGVALGKKWINNSGFVLELLGGAGRTLGGNDITPDFVFRGDLNIGYRF